MNILYAIQGTGNGHMSRAVEVGPILEKHGKVDYMVSGAQVDINLDKEIKYKSKGLGFYFGKKGGVDISQTILKNASKRLYREIKDFPIEKYDLIINDFEPVTAWSAKIKRKPCVALSHQSALLSKKSPKPTHKDPFGKMIINKYAPATKHYGFHFSSFDNNIFTPIVKKEIRSKEPKNFGHYTVYLPAYDDEALIGALHGINVKWEVFSKHTKRSYDHKNISIRPINSAAFAESITTSAGVLCGAGFETPSEALYLGKKLMVIPMKNQYEQYCNAAALEQMGIPVINRINAAAVTEINKWVERGAPLQIDYPDETESIIDTIIAEQLN
ncbi:glycosyl transferase [Fulvivirga sp. RKSG066]|uniref:glycosyltransferase family protein n=1 Tax=Fulvivirga aurantia TaxID=2529383 RepID=UPI0012BC2054|nr:glycosyltransferase family protein [Fulvivirga aurantia]MTI19976.1 glycosyl transferase [Fulvivirga aurantia]